MSRHLKRSFPPIVYPSTEILVLGSMPGDRSIAENEYYAHPRNRFWPMIAEITGNQPVDDYADKKQLLAKTRIGLWDVAQQAIRKGSLDSDIRNAVPNDIGKLIASLPQLRVIAFNGKKAEALYDRYFTRHANLKYFALPSTSPANASASYDMLCDRWRILL